MGEAALAVTDLVVISLEAWDGVWRRNQHLVSRLLAMDGRLRVLFVEPPADPLHDLRSGRRPRFARRARPSIRTPRLWTFRPLKALPRRLDPGWDDRLSRTVRRAAARIGMTDPVLWINDPGAARVSTRTGWRTVYDITDDWAAADRAPRERRRIVEGELHLLQAAAQVVACSQELVRRKAPHRPADRSPIVLIPNAVDVQAYRRPRQRPHDLPAGRAAVYVGTLHADRLDVGLCVETAAALRRTGVLALVGPDALADPDTRRLREAGVLLLGAKPHDQVPGYLQHADVLVVPHLVTPFTDSLDPIKLYEYQAVGRPVVATAVAGFRDAGVGTVAGRAAFPAAVVAAITRGDPDPPPSSPADWRERASAMASVLAELAGQR